METLIETEKEPGSEETEEMPLSWESEVSVLEPAVEEECTPRSQGILSHLRRFVRFFRFAGVSLLCTTVDMTLFYLLSLVTVFPKVQTIFFATATARIVSGTMNFLLNRYFGFRSEMPAKREAFRYLVLFFCQMGMSAGLVSLFSHVFSPVVAVKIVIDLCLFFLSFQVQKNWVFRKKGND